MKGKLSENAARLLILVDDHTERDWTTGKLGRYWVPTESRDYSTTLEGYVLVGGAGDVSSFKALERAGLIEQPRGAREAHRYAYAITEAGRVAVERMRESDSFPKPNGDL